MYPNFLIIFTLLLCSSSALEAKGRRFMAKPWKGSAIGPGFGGLYLKLAPSVNIVQKKARSSVVNLVHTKTLDVQILSYDLVKDSLGAVKIFVLPAGDYRVLQVGIKVNKGTLQYSGPSQETIRVKQQQINDGGKWFVYDASRGRIGFSRQLPGARQNVSNITNPQKRSNMRMIPATPKLPSAAGRKLTKRNTTTLNRRSVVPKHRTPVLPSAKKKNKVIANKPVQQLRSPKLIRTKNIRKSGGNKPVQRLSAKTVNNRRRYNQAKKFTGALGDKKKIKKFNLPVGKNKGKGQMRATYAFRQTVAFVYKVDVGGVNAYSKAISRAISVKDKEFRQCYKNALEDVADLQGMLKYKFIYEQGQTQFTELKLVSENVRNTDFIDCIYWKMAGLGISFKRDLKGSATLVFTTQ